MSASPQPNLFTADAAAAANKQTPLADRLRPKRLEDVVGHEQLLGNTGSLRQMVANQQLVSLLFWGPPGVGKTTLARLLAQTSGYRFEQLSAVNSGLRELRSVITAAEEALRYYQQKTVLFIDELHRYSKTQQDALLPYVENGTVTLLGATTENPSFQVIPALLSRMLMVRLQALTPDQVKTVLGRAIRTLGHLALQKEAVDFLVQYANGDARSALTLLEAGVASAPRNEEGRAVLRLDQLEQLAQQNRLMYDRQSDEHYDHASAYQKSMRGNDADAALYWLAKMVAGGEDPRFIARRLMTCAAEDVGLADPQAFMLAEAAYRSVEQLGWPEARIPLALATAYVARAPKSNAAYTAINSALEDVTHKGKAYPVPMHLRDSHYSGAKGLGHGQGYIYTHDRPALAQTFLPDAMVGTVYLEL
jgi:putative ATPase